MEEVVVIGRWQSATEQLTRTRGQRRRPAPFTTRTKIVCWLKVCWLKVCWLKVCWLKACKAFMRPLTILYHRPILEVRHLQLASIQMHQLLDKGSLRMRLPPRHEPVHMIPNSPFPILPNHGRVPTISRHPVLMHIALPARCTQPVLSAVPRS